MRRGLFFPLFKPVKFILGLPKWEFSTGKKHFKPGKNQENDFAPSEKYFSFAPAGSKASCTNKSKDVEMEHLQAVIESHIILFLHVVGS